MTTLNTEPHTVTLQTPIKRGEMEITQVCINSTLKQAGSLRGLKLYDILMSDVNSLMKLLPRVTTPMLTEVEVAQLDTWDFAQLGQEVAVFLQPASVMATDLTESKK